MAEIRDLRRALAQRPSDAAIGEARVAATTMQRFLDASGLGTSTLANVRTVLNASGLDSIRQATQALGSSSLGEITKSAEKATKALGAASYLQEATASLRAAQGVLGKIDLPRTPVLQDRDVPLLLRPPVDAALLTRDAVVELTGAVESLIGESKRSARRIEKLTVVIVVTSVLLVLLTALGLVLTGLLLVQG